MKLTVLGKYGPYGKAGVGAASGYLVTEGKFKMLCDMGPGVLSRLIDKVDVRELTGIYISHIHYDHTSDLLPFRYLLEEVRHPINIYTHKESGAWFDILFKHPLFNMVYIDENTELELENVKLSFYKMYHEITDYAIRFDGPTSSLLYTGDTAFNENIFRAADGCDVILGDCSKPLDFVGWHMTADKAVLIHEKTGAKVLATHLAPQFSPDEYFADVEGVEVAQEGVTYDI